MQKPKVSVIVPTFNRALSLRRCLDSLCAQTFKNFEVLVCDDGSTDDTKEVIESYRHLLNIKYFWNENSGGPAHPRNIGIKNSNAPYVAFLDSDDWWTTKKLEKVVKKLDQGFDFIYHPLISRPKRKKITISFGGSSAESQLQLPIFKNLLEGGNVIPNSSVVVRRSILTLTNGFSENLLACEDYDLWLRIAKIKAKFFFINENLGYYWVGGGNISSDLKRSISNLESLVDGHKINDEGVNLEKIFWINYSLGRMHLRANNYSKSILYLKSALKSSNGLIDYFKVCYSLVNAKISNALRGL